MFSDVIPCGTMLKLCFYMDLTYHALFWLYKDLPVMYEGLSVTHDNCNHDSHMNTIISQSLHAM